MPPAIVALARGCAADVAAARRVAARVGRTVGRSRVLLTLLSGMVEGQQGQKARCPQARVGVYGGWHRLRVWPRQVTRER